MGGEGLVEQLSGSEFTSADHAGKTDEATGSGSAAGARMRAAVITGPGQMRIAEVARPEPGPGQVRLRLEGCGVCASNLTPGAGPEWMQFPTEPGSLGHEAWGVVDAVGDGVTGLTAGDRVAALTYNAYAEYDL